MKKQFSPEPVEFNAQWHSYRLASGRKLLSVSAFIKHHTPAFDSIGNSERVALKRGITAQEVLAEWEAKAQASRQKGTEFHAKMEEYFVNREKFGRLESADPVVKKVLEQIPTLTMPNKNLEFHSEALIACPAWGLAGTSDLVVYSPKTNQAILYDFKTNAEIKREAFGGETLYYPFQMLENCDYDKYDLQLTLYGAMLMQMGIKIAGLAVIHIDHDGNVQKYPYPADRFEFIQRLDMPNFVRLASERTYDWSLDDREYQKAIKELEQSELPHSWISRFFTKDARNNVALKYIRMVSKGVCNPVEAYLYADVLEKMAKLMKDAVQEKAFQRADREPKGDRHIHGIKFIAKETPNYTYKHDPEWQSLKAAEDQLAEKRKAREEQMKNAAKMQERGQALIDDETGEKIPAAEVKYSQVLQFEYKAK